MGGMAEFKGVDPGNLWQNARHWKPMALVWGRAVPTPNLRRRLKPKAMARGRAVPAPNLRRAGRCERFNHLHAVSLAEWVGQLRSNLKNIFWPRPGKKGAVLKKLKP
jgi:hypothetical protein